MDPYSVLGVSRSATDQEIKKAYRKMSRKYHPDNFRDEAQKKQAEEQFRRVQEAYNAIVDERSGKTSGYGSYGGYGGNSGGNNYTEEQQHFMAAVNYINARRFNEALNVLNTIDNHNAMWYFLSSYANLGMGNNVIALDYAKRAAEMEPNNAQYQDYYRQLSEGGNPMGSFGSYGSPFGGYGSPFGGGYGGGGTYGGYGRYGNSYSSTCTGSWCLDMLCLNAMCGCC